MTYRIEVSSVAEAEADRAFLQLSQVTSPEKARQWYAGLLVAIASLARMPKRCSLAREKLHIRYGKQQTLGEDKEEPNDR